MSTSVIYSAMMVLPVSSTGIRDGAVLVGDDGRILAVDLLVNLRRDYPTAEVFYFPRGTIIPGAVNTHAHLGFRREGAPEAGSFSQWLEGLIERLPEKESWTAKAAENSAQEAIEAGTTYMAESSPYGECLPQLAASGMAGAVFAEFFPGDIGTPEESADYIAEKVLSLREVLPQRVDAQVSVHGPYTVDPEAARIAARRTKRNDEPLAIHLSESPEEVEFVRRGTGPLTNIFPHADWAGQGISPVAYAEKAELLGPRTIAAHLATGVSEEDLDILARTNTAVAHCPRSNRNLGCGIAPISSMIEKGIRVGIGTDGLWSGDDMNLWGETRVAAETHRFDNRLSLELATLRGAQALRLGEEIGSIEPGKWADLAIVEVDESRIGEDDGKFEREVLEAAAEGNFAMTIVGGSVVYESSREIFATQ